MVKLIYVNKDIMYKLLFFLVVFALPNTALFSQGNFYSKKFYSAANYSNKAEMAICKNQLEIAEAYYDTLFILMPNPTGRDVWNRALLAKEMGNKELEDKMVHILFYKGYDLDRIGQCFDTLPLLPLITPEYRKIKAQHKALADKILKDDQRVNRDKAINPEEWIETWLENIEKIKEYTKKVDSLNIPYYSLETAGFNISILHYFQLWGNSRALEREGFAEQRPYMKGLADIDFEANGLIPFIVGQIERGNYSQYRLASLLSFTKYPFPYEIIVQCDSLVFVKEPYLYKKTGELDSINSNREFLAVDNYEQFYTKARFVDSLRNNGEIFKAIPKDNIPGYFESLSNGCVYDLVESYRRIMFMKKPEDAESLMEKLKKSFGVE